MSKIISVDQAILLVKNVKKSDCLSVLANRIPLFLTEVSLRQIRELVQTFRQEDDRLECFESIVQNFPGIEGDLDSMISSLFRTEAIRERAYDILKEHNIHID